jgi:hypothetical protein
MTTDEKLARLRVHRNNVHRYRRLLSTRLSDLEREFLMKRLSEEQIAIDALSTTTFPFPWISTVQPPVQHPGWLSFNAGDYVDRSQSSWLGMASLRPLWHCPG